MKIYGPFRVELNIALTDGNQFANVTYETPLSDLPSLSAYREACKKCEEQIKEQMGDDWRLCTKREYFDLLCSEASGGLATGFAMPGSETEWDDE